MRRINNYLNIRKNMDLKFSFLVFIASLILTACNTVVTNVEIPQAEKKMVLFAFGSNLETSWRADATLSKPVFDNRGGDDFEQIVDGQLQISENQTSSMYLYDSNEGRYVLNNPLTLVAGKEYTMTFNSSKYGTCMARSTFPEPIEDLKVTLDSFNDQWGKQYKFKLSWKDNPATEDYYIIETFTVYRSDNQLDTQGSYYIDYVDDLKAIGGRYNHSSTIYSDEFDSEFIESFIIVVGRTDKALFKYGDALRNYNPDFPFNEPSPLPNNITNGLGLFSLINKTAVNIR